MPKKFRPSNRESSIISKIESSKVYARRQALNGIKDCIDELANDISMKLIEDKLIETTNKNSLEDQIKDCLNKVSHADDFDVDFKIAPFRKLVNNPHVISIYLTAFVLEDVLNHKYVVDIFGSDEEIYNCINHQVTKYLPI